MLRISMVLTTVFCVVSTVAEPVEIGISSPTWSRAGWLFMTTRDGAESTLTSVSVESALMMSFGWASGPSSRL